MMRIGTIVIALVALPFGSLLAGHSEAQTNALVEVLLRSALIRPNFDPQTGTIKGGPRYALTQIEFFAGDEEWATEERRTVFDWYLRHLPKTKQSYGVIRGRMLEENPMACVAINQCEIMGYTNAIPILYENARGVADPSRIASLLLPFYPRANPCRTVGG